jgi:hypothetical protein
MKKTAQKRERRTEAIPIRFSPKERQTVERIAEQEHDYASSFCRRIILNQIERQYDAVATR